MFITLSPRRPVHNRVSRFTANGDVAVAGSEVPILELDNLSGATNHNGGAIHFGPDGKLYIAVGENANGANSQTLSNPLGKVLRINSDGTIPSDNPFFNTTGARKEIWALGLRNPFTFAFQPGTGRLFINDVGQKPGKKSMTALPDRITAGQRLKELLQIQISAVLSLRTVMAQVAPLAARCRRRLLQSRDGPISRELCGQVFLRRSLQ